MSRFLALDLGENRELNRMFSLVSKLIQGTEIRSMGEFFALGDGFQVNVW